MNTNAVTKRGVAVVVTIEGEYLRIHEADTGTLILSTGYRGRLLAERLSVQFDKANIATILAGISE